VKIAVRGVSKRFGGVVAVERVALEIADGELFTLLGPSGCGKTTLLRLLAGFARPDEGTVLFGERVVNDLPPHARNIGMVFQNYALWPHMTVFQNVAYGLRLRRLTGAVLQAAVREGLRKVNLAELEGRYPGQLSGGQQQRVALARALVLNPDLLLLDEPLSNLDAQIRAQVRGEIRTLQRQLGITAIYVTHDQEEALSLSDRVAVMREGRVEQVGPPRALYEQPRTRFVADFVGTNNLVPGTVVRRAGTTLIVDTPIGSLAALGPDEVGPGQACVLAIRPEHVTLDLGGSEAEPDDGNAVSRVKGAVRLAAYLGHTLRYDVEVTGGFVLRVDVRDHADALPPGQPVTLSLPAPATRAIPAGEPRGLAGPG
jgi:ABC-type Fe3+/spermidine/putrescine transport system ATPase subunit